MVQRAYSNELFRVAHARCTGTKKAEVVTATEDKIFAVVKTWLLAGKDGTVFGQMEIRRRIVNPKKAANIRECAKVVNEWDSDVDKLRSYAGADALPHAHDLLTSYMNLLDPDPQRICHR